MRAVGVVVAVVVGMACHKESERTPVPAAPIGSSDAARATEVRPKSVDRIDKLADDIHAGDGASEAVAKIVAVLGPPNANGANGIQWLVVDNAETCSVVAIVPDGAYVNKVHILRLGPVDPMFKDCSAGSKQHVAVPSLADPPKYDLEAPVIAAMTLWRDKDYQKLFEMTNPGLRETIGGPEALARMAAVFAPITGNFVKLGTPMTYSTRDFASLVTVPGEFDKGTITLRLGFKIVDGKPMLSTLGLDLPPAMQRKPVVADAEKLARHALDLLLANQLSEMASLGVNDLFVELGKTAATLGPRLKQALDKLGAVTSIKLREQRDCDELQCLTYDVVTANGKATATFSVAFDVSRWELTKFNIEPN